MNSARKRSRADLSKLYSGLNSSGVTLELLVATQERRTSRRNCRSHGTAAAQGGSPRTRFSAEGEDTMLMKSIAAGLAGSALLVGVAFAQSTTATSDATTLKNDAAAAATSAQGDWRASKVVGLKVYNDANDSVGSINDLLMDKSGNIKLVVLGVGGFLGMGEHLVAVPFDKVKFSTQAISYGTATNNTNPPGRPATAPPTTTTGAATGTNNATTTTSTSSASKWYPDHAVFNATKDELKSMPEFKYSE
jgi:sporulation protein YlmC with PRC-barrel domain